MAILQLLGLPEDLLVIILSILDARSVLSCKASCRRLRDVISQSAIYTPATWSVKHGLQYLLPPSLLFKDYKALVRNWENDWFNFSVGNEAAMRSMSGPSQDSLGLEWYSPTECNFHLRSGCLIQMRRYKNPGWSHIDLSLQRELRGFIPAPDWTNIYLGADVTIEGWSLDLDRDLVAASLQSPGILECRREIHLMHFTTGAPHESASAPVVQLEFRGTYNKEFGTHIEIMGDYLVVLLAHSAPSLEKNLVRRMISIGRPEKEVPRRPGRGYQSLYLVDWVKGHVKYQQHSSANTYFPALASISEDTFVLGLKLDKALALCRITYEGDGLTICTLRKLKLPTIGWNTRIHVEHFSRAPSGTDKPSTPRRDSTLLFRNSSSESVLSFYVRADNGQDKPPTMFFYANPSALRTLARLPVAKRELTSWVGLRIDKVKNTIKSNWLYRQLSHREPSSASGLPFIVPWDDWGPKTTRWISAVGRRQSLSGMRCAISQWPGNVRVLDFNPERVRVVKTLVSKNRLKIGRDLLVAPSRPIEKGFRWFRHDVVSELPYYELRRSGARGQLFIDDQWVVQIPYEEGRPILIHSINEARRGS